MTRKRLLYVALVSTLMVIITVTVSAIAKYRSDSDATHGNATRQRYVSLQIEGPLDITGNDILSRALNDLGPAVATRANQIAARSHSVLVEWPNEELRNRAAKLKLQDVESIAAQIDLPLFPWQTEEQNATSQINVEYVESQNNDESTTILSLQLAVELVESEEQRGQLLLRASLLNKNKTDVALSPSTTCRKDIPLAEALPDENNAVLRELVDYISACSLAMFFEHYFSLNHERADYQPYTQIFPERQSLEQAIYLLRGLESYGNFIGTENRVSNAAALEIKTAGEYFLKAHDTPGTASDFAQYLFVHSSTALHGYPFDQRPEHEHNKASELIDSTFTSTPFDAPQAQWLKAVAFEMHSRVEDARELWAEIARDRPQIQQVSNVSQTAQIRLANMLRAQRQVTSALTERSRTRGARFDERQNATILINEALDLDWIATNADALLKKLRSSASLLHMLNADEESRALLRELRLLELSNIGYRPSDHVDQSVKERVRMLLDVEHDGDTENGYRVGVDSGFLRYYCISDCDGLRKDMDAVLRAISFAFQELSVEHLARARGQLDLAFRKMCSAYKYPPPLCAGIADTSVDRAMYHIETFFRPELRQQAVRDNEVVQIDQLIAAIALAVSVHKCGTGDPSGGLELAREFTEKPTHKSEFLLALAVCYLSKFDDDGLLYEPQFGGMVFDPPYDVDWTTAEIRHVGSVATFDPQLYSALILLEYGDIWSFASASEPYLSPDLFISQQGKLASGLKKRLAAKDCDAQCTKDAVNEVLDVYFDSNFMRYVTQVDMQWSTYHDRQKIYLMDEGDNSSNHDVENIRDKIRRVRETTLDWSLPHQVTKASQSGERSKGEHVSTLDMDGLIKRLDAAKKSIIALSTERMQTTFQIFFLHYGTLLGRIEGQGMEGLSTLAALVFFRVMNRVNGTGYAPNDAQDLVSESIGMLSYSGGKNQDSAQIQEAGSTIFQQLVGRGFDPYRISNRKRVAIGNSAELSKLFGERGVTCTSAPGGPSHGADECLDRFLVHMLGESQIFDRDNDPGDAMMFIETDIMEIYEIWRSNQNKIPRNPAVSLWWLLADEVAQGFDSFEFMGDVQFLTYLAAVNSLATDDADACVSKIRDLDSTYSSRPEVRSLEALAWIKAGISGAPIDIMRNGAWDVGDDYLLISPNFNALKGHAYMMRARDLDKAGAAIGRVMHNWRKAQSAYKKSLISEHLDDGEMYYTLINLGAAYAQTGDYDKAIELLAHLDRSEASKTIIAICYWQNGDRIRAGKILSGLRGSPLDVLSDDRIYFGEEFGRRLRRALKATWEQPQ